ANAGIISIRNNTQFHIAGVVKNTGQIQLVGSVNPTYMIFDGGPVTFTGAGQIVLSANSGNNYVYGTGGTTVTNVDNTILGAGLLGNGQNFTLINQAAGTINANQTGRLTLNVAAGVRNTGLIEDTGSGGLLIQNTLVDNTGNANSGKLQANGS